MSDSTLSSGNSASPHVIRCAECHELVPADRVRHREERVRVAAKPAPGQWRAGGPPIFRPTTHGPRPAPGSRLGTPVAPPSQSSSYAIERIPVCLDCLRRQRTGLYAVCGLAAACALLAVALYSHEETPPSGQRIALETPRDERASPAPATETETATPTPRPLTRTAAALPAQEAGDPQPVWQPIKDAANRLFAFSAESPPPAPATASAPAPPSTVVASAAAAPAAPTAPPAEDEDKASDPKPIWQPIWDAAARLFTSPSPAPSPTKDTPPAPAVLAAAPPVAPKPGATPTVGPTPPLGAATAPNSAQPAAASTTDVAGAASSDPPIWAKEKAPRKVARATPVERRTEPAANAVALRNDGYLALEQRRYREALTLLQQSTMMGDAYAPMYIGQLFEKGIGVARDVGQASYWYGIAINRGNGTALAAFNRMRINPY